MPPKPDLVFNTAPLAVESDHSAFNVKFSLAKPVQAMSHTTESMAPIIEDWVSDSKDESEPNGPHRVSVQPIEVHILAATPKPTIKTSSGGKRKNRKTCFVCRSVDHLIKDLLPKSKPVSVTDVRQISATVPKIMKSRPRPAHPLNRKSNPSIRSAVKGKKGKWVWRPKCPILDHDSRTSGNMSYLSDFQELNGGYVAFGGNPKGVKILGKGKIKTGKLDFEDVYFVKELKFNLYSVSQMCDKKNKVLFTDSECLVLSLDSKLPDESQVLLRVPRENNMYNVNLKDIVPSGDLTCLFTKATIDESNLWHRRLGHINFKTINKLVKGNLVGGLPTKVFENHHTCVACKKGKQHRASCKTKPNRVLVTKPHNKTPYKLLYGRTPSIGFMRPFGCPVTILNTLDTLGKIKGKVDEGFLVRYSVNSKAFKVFNSRTRIIQETLHVNFLENKPNVAGTGLTWLFDIDSLTKTMNYQPVTTGNQTNPSAERDTTFAEKEHDVEKPESVVNLSPSRSALSGEKDDMTKKKDKGKSPVECFLKNRDLNAVFEDFSKDSSNDVSVASPIVPTTGHNYSNGTNPISAAGTIVNAAGHYYSNSSNPISVAGPSNSNSSPTHGQSSLRDTYQPPDMVEMEDIVYSDHENVGAEADFNNLETSITVYRNKKDERGIIVRNKARLVAQGHTQEEGIDYKEVFAPVGRIEAIRLFLAYASFIGFMVYQMDVKSAFMYGTIEEEVYACQPSGFEDPDHPEKVYKVVKALYGLHQAPRAWYETLATYLLENGFHRGQIDQTLFIKKQKGDILLVQIYVKQKEDGIFINQDKYVVEILKKFGLTEGKSASTPIDTEKTLLKDYDGEDVDVHIYRSMIGSLMYLTSSRPDIMFAVCACARFQVTPKVSHLHAEKRIFRYLKGKPNLGLWYPKDSPIDLVAYSDNDYAGASLDRKSTTGGCQFLGCRLILGNARSKQLLLLHSQRLNM
nr:putative ribonuclease H-like domain-containing protein [Tanacetum cinerariifolium]